MTVNMNVASYVIGIVYHRIVQFLVSCEPNDIIFTLLIIMVLHLDSACQACITIEHSTRTSDHSTMRATDQYRSDISSTLKLVDCRK